jgi:hypothetical protein
MRILQNPLTVLFFQSIFQTYDAARSRLRRIIKNMAKASAVEQSPTAPAPETTATAAATPKYADLAKGFEGRGQRDIDGWLKVEVGAEVVGKLIGWMERDGVNDGDTVRVVVVEVATATPAWTKGKIQVTVPPGGVVGVPVNASLRPILGFVATGAKFWAFCKAQKDIGKGRKMFVWDLRVERGAVPTTKLPPSLGAARSAEYAVDGGDQIPF